MMNKFDERYNFRLATRDDIEKIMKYIHDEWSENHILAHDRELFVWQYGRTEYGDMDNINVVLMEEKTGELVGFVGFIAYSDEKERLHISQAMTIVNSIGMMPMAGLELMKRQMQLVGEKITFSYGTNPNTIKPLWESVFRNEVGMMQQYYMLNSDVETYKVADIYEKIISTPGYSECSLKEISSIDEIEIDFGADYNRLPYKSKNFLQKRYFEHPVYEYRKWCVRDTQKNCCGIVFGRNICVNHTKILRVVDFRGDLDVFYSLGQALYNIMKEEQCEYIDVMASGLDETRMNESGFSLLEPGGENVIPNYFEPFERKNVTVHYQKSADIVVFKADGDQDRPNKR